MELVKAPENLTPDRNTKINPFAEYMPIPSGMVLTVPDVTDDNLKTVRSQARRAADQAGVSARFKRDGNKLLVWTVDKRKRNPNAAKPGRKPAAKK